MRCEGVAESVGFEAGQARELEELDAAPLVARRAPFMRHIARFEERRRVARKRVRRKRVIVRVRSKPLFERELKEVGVRSASRLALVEFRKKRAKRLLAGTHVLARWGL